MDCSLSSVVQRAWGIAKGASFVSPADSGLPRDGDRRRQSIELPIEICAELEETAAREDRSMSSLVQRAPSSAWPTITTLVDQSIARQQPSSCS